jgi:hypothetical protein
MTVNNLFNLIRHEDTCLWIGSGFSLYAGYPSANELINILYDNLNIDEQKSIDKNLPLSNFTEAFVRLKSGSKNELKQILRKEFLKKPTSADLHAQLSFIPHFKSIITTNYDTLIEDSYLNRSIVLREAKDIPLVNNDLVKIYKVHGDFNSQDIIITSSDYSTFYNTDYKNPYWSSLITELSTKNIIFLGYGFEDPNFWALFDNLDKLIGSNRKQRFFISPGINDIKKGDLSRKNIDYIDMNADQFLNELNMNLKQNIVSDFENKKVSVDTFTEYLSHHDLTVSIEVQDELRRLKSIKKKSGIISGNLKFSITNEKSQKLLDDFINGKGGRAIELPKSDLNNIETYVEDFKINSGMDGLDKLLIKYQPTIKKKFSIVFDKVNFELENLEFEAFRFADHIEVSTKMHGFSIEIVAPTDDLLNIEFKIKIVEPDIKTSVKDCLEVYSLIYHLFNAEEFKIFIEQSQKPFIHKLDRKIIAPDLSYKLNLYEALQKIERFFNVKFSNFKSTDNETIRDINQLISLIDNKYYLEDYPNGITINDPPETFLSQIHTKAIAKDSLLLLQIDGPGKFEILGLTIELGKNEIQILNVELKKIEQKLSIKSKNNIYVRRFELTGLSDIPPEAEKLN